jgi:hypothetical protein
VAHRDDEDMRASWGDDAIVVNAENRPTGGSERRDQRGVVGALGSEALGEKGIVAEAHLKGNESDARGGGGRISATGGAPAGQKHDVGACSARAANSNGDGGGRKQVRRDCALLGEVHTGAGMCEHAASAEGAGAETGEEQLDRLVSAESRESPQAWQEAETAWKTVSRHPQPGRGQSGEGA